MRRIAISLAALLALSIAPVVATTAGAATGGNHASLRSEPQNPTPKIPCETTGLVTVSLNVHGAATLLTASGTPFGAAAAQKLAVELETGAGNVCSLKPTSSEATALAAIKALYATNKSQAISELKSFAANPSGPTPQVWLIALIESDVAASPARLSGHTPGPCPMLAPTIDVSGAVDVAGDINAIATLQALGLDSDTSLVDSLVGDAQMAFQQWAGQANPQTVGDWTAIAQNAQLLGDDAFANTALSHAQAAAAKAAKVAKPNEPCTASQSDIDCYQQAAAAAAFFNTPGVESPAQLQSKCQALWQITVDITGGTGGSDATLHYSTGEFAVKGDVISPPAASNKGWPGSFSGGFSTGNCPGQIIVHPANFTYMASGRVIPTGFYITLDAPNFKLNYTKNGDSVCINLAAGFFSLLSPLLQHYPIVVAIASGATSAHSVTASGGLTVTADLKKIS